MCAKKSKCLSCWLARRVARGAFRQLGALISKNGYIKQLYEQDRESEFIDRNEQHIPLFQYYINKGPVRLLEAFSFWFIVPTFKMAVRLSDETKDFEKHQEHRHGVFHRHKKLLLSLFALLTLGSFISVHGGCQHFGRNRHMSHNKLPEASEKSKCDKVDALRPSFNSSIDLIFNDATYKKKSIENLAKAVQIPTEIQDVNPEPSKDHEYYKYFYEFHHFLKDAYPLIHENLKLEKVNEIGLLYTWEGSEKDLKPMLFMAHQDVVPVERKTWDLWKFPPFSGYYEEETDLLWGRGSNDCKNLLTAEMEAIEQLLRDDYKPKRTVLLSFGFDEESSGPLGAKNLAAFIRERYGDDSIFSIIDEGAGVAPLGDNLYVASPINAEKGYVDVIVTVNGHGGHSSVPPEHTTIGVAADLIKLLEDNKFDFDFELDNPIYGLLTCVAEHSDKVPKSLKKTILGASKDEKKKAALQEYLSRDSRFRELIRTTEAIDIVKGGIKANALPEVTSFLVNHRIEMHSSVNETVNNDLKYAKEVAEKFGYGVSLSDEFVVPATELGYIDVSYSKSLEPAPISPTSGPVWNILAGTIQDVFQNGVFADQPEAEIYVTSDLISGNTDTRYYWDLTKNIYRFAAAIFDLSVLKTIHSVNEHVNVSGHLSATAFIYEYIVNVDENT